MAYETSDEELIIREPIAAYGKSTFTIEEYLAFEKASPVKHEYYKGKIFEMQGASRNHERIVVNLIRDIDTILKNGPCETYASNLRIYIPENTLFTYPDLSIMCKEAKESDIDDESFLNPSVIVEVLSPSTKNYNRNEKFELYKDILTLKEYILVDSVQPHVVVYNKSNNNLWSPTEYSLFSDIVRINTVNVSLSMADIYNKVDFSSLYKVGIKKTG